MATPTGSIKRVDIFGISYDVTGDAEPTKKPRVEKETTATSGAPLINSTKMVPQFESLTLALSAEQHETLDKSSQENEEGPIAVTNADGKTWRDEGQIEIGDYNVKASTADVKLIPNSDWALL